MLADIVILAAPVAPLAHPSVATIRGVATIHGLGEIVAGSRGVRQGSFEFTSPVVLISRRVPHAFIRNCVTAAIVFGGVPIALVFLAVAILVKTGGVEPVAVLSVVEFVAIGRGVGKLGVKCTLALCRAWRVPHAFV